ncbi:MAG: DUF5063 domain-containing protein [Duncaniella sp.]|nr:DUF5063 domain-containing protein [Muribaculum sp.]MCM1254938.1 DUF5063 domain-containing protein [Duncaniella sp.]
MELNTNSLAFIGLCNEFCMSVENVRGMTMREFVCSMLRLLPRIYISASDLNVMRPADEEEEPYMESYLDEDYYESVRRGIESLLGADDVYLEVFEEDMKYSDTPIGESIAEGVSDIFQVLYNFITMVRDAPTESISLALVAVKDDFDSYWSQKLCNLLRPLNHLRYKVTNDGEDELY